MSTTSLKLRIPSKKDNQSRKSFGALSSHSGKTTLTFHHLKIKGDSLTLLATSILNKQYMSVFIHEADSNIPTTAGTPFPDMDTIQINEEGILKLLRKINPRKASGPDNIPARILRHCAFDLAPILTMIFQT